MEFKSAFWEKLDLEKIDGKVFVLKKIYQECSFSQAFQWCCRFSSNIHTFWDIVKNHTWLKITQMLRIKRCVWLQVPYAHLLSYIMENWYAGKTPTLKAEEQPQLHSKNSGGPMKLFGESRSESRSKSVEPSSDKSTLSSSADGLGCAVMVVWQRGERRGRFSSRWKFISSLARISSQGAFWALRIAMSSFSGRRASRSGFLHQYLLHHHQSRPEKKINRNQG